MKVPETADIQKMATTLLTLPPTPTAAPGIPFMGLSYCKDKVIHLFQLPYLAFQKVHENQCVPSKRV